MSSEKWQTEERPSEPFSVAGLPMQTLEAYAHLWQFETWLRCLVYVQLRASHGDRWESQVRSDKALKPKANDKSLTHMPTPEEGVLSFVQLSELLRVVGEEWKLFEAYLLPKNLWDAKLQEVLAIRHRIAHFRTIHSDDLARLRQFLRDVDHGFWRFCTSYNDAKPVLPQENDPVVMSFVARDLFAWKEVEERTWARIGHAGPNERLTMTTEVIGMPWASWSLPIAGNAGFLYDVAIYARGQRSLDYRQLLLSTKSQHQHVVHICLDQAAKLARVTIPAVLGAHEVIRIIETFYDAALNALVPGVLEHSDDAVQRYSEGLPEYVLGPRNPLTYLTPDMPCSFFQGISNYRQQG